MKGPPWIPKPPPDPWGWVIMAVATTVAGIILDRLFPRDDTPKKGPSGPR